LNDGIEFFLNERQIPFEIGVLFTQFIKSEISAKVIIKNEVMFENIIKQLSYAHVSSLWLRFIKSLRDNIEEDGEQIKEE